MYMPTFSIDQLLDMDATALARAILEKRVSIYDVVSTFISHAKKENVYIHAIVEDRFEDALMEAKDKDRLLETTTQVGPLFGVPMSVKESFNVQGMKTTGGLMHLKNNIADQDAPVIQSLKEAGAIIVCKTNTPALCFCQETDNKLYGRTNNAWEHSHTAGGSSGGEAALLSVGGAAVGIGSDIGGSIRFPSHFNGIIGFKPGRHQVSSVGHFPEETIPLQKRMAGSGPMGKSVRDMELMYELMSSYTQTNDLSHPITFNFLPQRQPYPLNDASVAMMDKVESFMKTIGEVDQSYPPFFKDSATIWQEIMSIDGAKMMKEAAFPEHKTPYIQSYIKEKLFGTSTIHAYLSWAFIGASMFKPSQQRIGELTSLFSQGDEDLYTFYENRISVLPVYHSGALPHGEVYKEIFSIKKTYKKFMPYVAYANVWGLPSLTIPITMDDNQMPMAIQLVSRVGNEDLLFSIGKHIEKQFQGYVRSSPSTRV